MHPSRAAAIILSFLLCTMSHVDAQLLGRGQREARTINTDRYEVVVQRNGHISLLTIAGEPLVQNARAELRLAGQEQPRELRVDYRNSARMPVNDPLGEGQGLLFAHRELEWYVRAYPTKPFITVQAVYVNTGNRPVQVAELIPWSVGSGGRRGGAVIMGPAAEQTHLLAQDAGVPRVVQITADSDWNLAAQHPLTGRSLIAGFLTSNHAETRIEMVRTGAAADDAFDTFRARCIYDPPREVPPGGRLESEVFYLGITEPNLLLGLERYGKAVAVWNGVRDARPFMPHGAMTPPGEAPTEAAIRAELDVLERDLLRYGWEHYTIGPGWERALGDWEPDSARFPGDMAELAAEMKRRGIRPGIWVAPFTVEAQAPLAAQHPEWMGTPNDEGRALVGEGRHILDITAPGAYEHVRDLARKLTVTWGFDTLAADGEGARHPLLLLEQYHDPGVTRIEALRMGLRALQEGMRQDAFLSSGGPPPVAGIFAHAVRTGKQTTAQWNASAGTTGAVDAMTQAARRFYMSPHLYLPEQPAMLGADGDGLNAQQHQAWLTGAALLGSTLNAHTGLGELSPQDTQMLQRLLPVPERSAVPVDLMMPRAPRIWHLPLRTGAGAWDILALFNWDARQEQEVDVPFEALGLQQGRYHTVYDFWQDHYHGTAADRLRIRVPAGSVQLLGLRPHENRPMLLASNRHFSQGALDHEALQWDAAASRLRGRLQAIANTDYLLSVLVPENFRFVMATAEGANADAWMAGSLLRIRIEVEAGGLVAWEAIFE